ncbi:MAG: radical SAM protein [Pseudomonadota bacterium]
MKLGGVGDQPVHFRHCGDCLALNIGRASGDDQARIGAITARAADIEREAIAAMPEVDGLIANTAKLDPRAWNAPVPQAPLPPTRTRAFVAVQNGCDHACTFCVIPQGRGKSRSLSVADVLAQVGLHLKEGAKEVVLTGVDLTSWGQDFEPKLGLGALVTAILAEFTSLERLRLSSVDGIEIDEALFDLIAHEPRVMPHLHLSLQHGHNLILKRMKRRHSRGDALDLVTRLRAARPEIAVGADLIAGFPTETSEHHAANLAIIADLDIVHGHIFPYSPRPNTPASRMPQLDRSIIKARAAELRAAVARRRAAWLDGFVGETLSVLAERDGTGYAPSYARVALPEGTRAGAMVDVTIRAVEGGLLV